MPTELFMPHSIAVKARSEGTYLVYNAQLEYFDVQWLRKDADVKNAEFKTTERDKKQSAQNDEAPS